MRLGGNSAGICINEPRDVLIEAIARTGASGRTPLTTALSDENGK